MFDLDNWQEIFSTIKKNKLRTFLTAFGVFWGVFMLVVMMGSGNGLKNGVLRDFNGTATNSFFVWAQRTNKAYDGFQPGRRFNYNNDDVAAIREFIPELAAIAPRNQLGNYEGRNAVYRNNKTGSFSVYGDYPDTFKIETLNLLDGRTINKLDIDQKRKIALIGTRVRDLLFNKGENPIGEYIKINGVYFAVVGVFYSRKTGRQAEEETSNVHVPFTTFQTTFNYGDRVGWFSFMAKDGIQASKVEEKVITLLKERHHISPEDQMAVGHWNMEKEYNKIMGLFNGITGLVWVVGVGTLLAGIIGVSNIMLIIVRERTREIGIKRALGAEPYMIIGQIILESVFLTSIAGYFGLIAGLGVIQAVASSIPADAEGPFYNPEVDVQLVLISLAILVVSGALAGLIPAKRAVEIAPIDALRAE